ncbi:MAG: leucine-rich repeat protein, partial [Clostridia bacterium]|nr:leucine-rich repeat protein [Clostridia bacterium]
TMLICWPKGKPITNVVIADTVKMIAETAFVGNLLIESITFEGDVIIGGRAFMNCASLTQVTFESQTPSTFIGANIFQGCNGNLKIYVPASAVDAYKQAVLLDVGIINLITAK